MGLEMFKKLFADKEIRKFYIIALVIGFVMSVMISVWMTPDEDNHLELIEKAIHNPMFMERIEESLDIDRAEFFEKRTVNVKQVLSSMVKSPTYTVKEMLPKGISLSAIKYLPCIIGMELGIVLHLPTFWVLQLGELFSLLFYAFVCAMALKLCPFKKGVMAVFMLAPMMMQGAGSFSHDAIVVPLVFWIICDIFYLRYEKETIELNDVLKLLAVWLLATYIKIPYTFIILLVFMIPLNKYHIRIGKVEINEAVIKKWRWPVLAAGVVIMAVGIYLFRQNVWIQIIYGVTTEFRRTLYLLKQTAIEFDDHLLISSVGNFGWLDAPVLKSFAYLFYVALFVLALAGGDGSAKKITKKDRIIVLGTFAVLVMLILFSMIHHTITMTLFGKESSEFSYNIREALYQIPFIGGLQGRYFLPFISLFFMQIGSLEIMSRKTTKIAVAAGGIIVYFYVGFLLLTRYWLVG